MSWELLAWARAQHTGSPGRKAVLMTLAEYADEADSCFPGQQLIADATEQSVRTVRNHLADLEAAGLITRQARYVHTAGGPGGRTSDRYTLQMRPAESAANPGGLGATETGLAATGDSLSGSLLPGNNQDELLATEPPAISRDFETFWKAYPRHTDKGSARKAWAAAIRKTTVEVIVAGAKRYAADPNREDRYTKHAATWLNAEAWDNPWLPARQGQRVQRSQQQVDTDRDQPGGEVVL